jgi:hypothetical protein
MIKAENKMKEKTIKESIHEKGLCLIILTVVILLPFSFITAKPIGAKITDNTVSYGIEWSRTYGGTSDDEAGAVIQTTDSGYAFTGWYGLTNTKSSLWFVKTNNTGHHQWNKTFSCGYCYGPRALIQTTDSGYALLGLSSDWGDTILIKTDVNGHQEWNQSIGNGEIDHAFSIIQTIDGGFMLSGYSTSYGTNSQDFWLVKVNSTGYHEWNRSFGGNGNELA